MTNWEIDSLFEELHGDIEEVRLALIEPDITRGGPEWLELVRELTDNAHLMLHEVIWQLALSLTQGSDLVPFGKRLATPSSAVQDKRRYDVIKRDEEDDS